MAFKDQLRAHSPLASIVYSAGTDVGMRREENQDSYGIMLGETYKLFIVADGMGGVQGGAIASNLAITTVEKNLRDKAYCTRTDLVAAIQAGNTVIHDKGKDDPSLTGMGTTLVALLCTEKEVHIANVGDSRLYSIRGGHITRLTEDHTLVQELVRSGALTEDQAEHHPVSHMLTRSLGPSQRIEVDCFPISQPLYAKDRFLLCSDGLYNMVKEQEIGEIVSTHSTDDAVQILIDLANERGGTDNITVIIIDVGSEYPESLEVHSQSADEEEEAEYLENDVATYESGTGKAVPSMIGGYHKTGGINEAEEKKAAEQIEEIAERTELIQNQGEREELIDSFEEEEEEDVPSDEYDNAVELHEEYVAPVRTTQPLIARLPLLIGGFLGGIIATFLIFKMEQTPSSGHVPDNGHGEPIIAESETTYTEDGDSESSRSVLPILSTIDSIPSVSVPQRDIDDVLGDSQPQHLSSKIGPAERSSIVKRKNDLRNFLINLNDKLSKFEKPLSGELGEMLKDSTKKAEEVQAKIDQIKADTDLATRRLAIWYDRKRRLETTDAINMAGEVAVMVPIVKQKKEEFERATWDYLKEVEALRYGPSDSSKEAHVSELVKIRAAKMKELAEVVRENIGRSLSDADHGVAELTVQRSQLENNLESIRSDLDFVRTVTGNDSSKRQQLRSELIKRKEAAETELVELEKLLPKGDESF